MDLNAIQTWLNNSPGTLPAMWVILLVLLSWPVGALVGLLAGRTIRHASALRFRGTSEAAIERRRSTLESLVRSAAFSCTFAGLLLAALSIIVGPVAVVTLVGLVSAGVGLSARPLISDFMAGILLIFEDQFTVGEKVEVDEVTGTVEFVNIRTTHIRGDSGELYIVPNGDIRVVRNFSRGTFSPANITVSVSAQELAAALPVLRRLASRAFAELDEVIEEPLLYSEAGVLASQVMLTLKVKARYGSGAAVRTRLLEMANQELAANLGLRAANSVDDGSGLKREPVAALRDSGGVR